MILRLEEPENSIHPRAIEAVLRSFEAMRDTSVWLSTHSPVVLANTPLARVLCMRLMEDGVVKVVRGNRHPQLKDWKGGIDIGTLFAAGGAGMKDCVFLLADLEMRAFIEGFFNRPRFHLSLGTAPFTHDIIADTQGSDPGVYTRAHELLRPYHNTHGRAAILLDAQWDGSPGPDAIRAHIGSNMRNSGWSEGRFIVTVIDPEPRAELSASAPRRGGETREKFYIEFS